MGAMCWEAEGDRGLWRMQQDQRRPVPVLGRQLASLPASATTQLGQEPLIQTSISRNPVKLCEIMVCSAYFLESHLWEEF